MNIKQANQIPIVDVLSRLGFEQIRQHSGHERWMQNPFRGGEQEETPSFSVNVRKNEWYDHQNGQGGNLLELVKLYHQCSPSEALSWLRNGFSGVRVGAGEQSALRSPEIAKEDILDKPRYEMVSTQSIRNKGLIYYLSTRGLQLSTARAYLQEGTYRDTETGKEFYGLALKNHKDGYAVRTKDYKTVVGQSSFTMIEGESGNSTEEPGCFHIFEGMTDFLTVLENLGAPRAKQNVIILNSLSHARKAAEYLMSYEPLELYLWLDNEVEGSDAHKAMLRAQDYFLALDAVCYDASDIYTGFKDVNEMWVKTHKKPFTLRYQPIEKPDTPISQLRQKPNDQLRLNL